MSLSSLKRLAVGSMETINSVYRFTYPQPPEEKDMARKKLREIRFQRKRKRRKKPAHATSSNAPEVSAQIPKPSALEKQDIAAKLIPLSLLSAKEAQRSAEKTIDQVLSAIIHVLSEGDINISEFGDFKAIKSARTGEIGISFTPCEKLKRAVEARLNAMQAA